MKATKLNKILITVLCFSMIVAMSAMVLATEIGGVSVNPDTTGKGAGVAKTVSNNVVGIIKVVGIILSVGCLMVLGIKYMMGSAEEKAEYKKTFIPYLVGAILLFGASAFAKQLYDWANGIFTTTP